MYAIQSMIKSVKITYCYQLMNNHRNNSKPKISVKLALNSRKHSSPYSPHKNSDSSPTNFTTSISSNKNNNNKINDEPQFSEYGIQGRDVSVRGRGRRDRKKIFELGRNRKQNNLYSPDERNRKCQGCSNISGINFDYGKKENSYEYFSNSSFKNDKNCYSSSCKGDTPIPQSSVFPTPASQVSFEQIHPRTIGSFLTNNNESAQPKNTNTNTNTSKQMSMSMSKQLERRMQNNQEEIQRLNKKICRLGKQENEDQKRILSILIAKEQSLCLKQQELNKNLEKIVSLKKENRDYQVNEMENINDLQRKRKKRIQQIKRENSMLLHESTATKRLLKDQGKMNITRTKDNTPFNQSYFMAQNSNIVPNIFFHDPSISVLHYNNQCEQSKNSLRELLSPLQISPHDL